MENAFSIFRSLSFGLLLWMLPSCSKVGVDSPKESATAPWLNVEAETVELQTRTITFKPNPDHMECVLQLPISVFDDLAVGKNHNLATEIEIKFVQHLQIMTGFQYPVITNPLNEISNDLDKQYNFYPSYFDCKLSKQIFDRIFSLYYDNSPPHINFVNRDQYFNILDNLAK